MSKQILKKKCETTFSFCFYFLRGASKMTTESLFFRMDFNPQMWGCARALRNTVACSVPLSTPQQPQFDVVTKLFFIQTLFWTQSLIQPYSSLEDSDPSSHAKVLSVWRQKVESNTMTLPFNPFWLSRAQHNGVGLYWSFARAPILSPAFVELVQQALQEVIMFSLHLSF